MLEKSKVLPDQANWPMEEEEGAARVGVWMKAKAEKPYFKGEARC